MKTIRFLVFLLISFSALATTSCKLPFLTDKVITPVIAPEGGNYSSPLNVTITCNTEGAIIYYTTDGSTPTTASTEYTAPISVTTTTTIKAIGTLDQFEDSDVAEETYTIGSTGNDMVLIPGGSFSMGDTQGVGETWELPVHSVNVSSFYIGRYEVTYSEWLQYMPYVYNLGDDYPVQSVSWYNALKYCNLRSIGEGLTPVYSINGTTDPNSWGNVPNSANATWNAAVCNWSANGYRLPTEAEWEYAARARSDLIFAGSNDIDAVAWYEGNNTTYTPKPVGGKLDNGNGLFDMSGNVWEWCWDWYEDYSSAGQTNPHGPNSGTLRVGRGGCWDVDAQNCRVASRNINQIPSQTEGFQGLRVCRSY
jgi:formylglycine-generating enzyme